MATTYPELDAPTGRDDRRAATWLALGVSILLAASLCVHLSRVLRATGWSMDADEAVHAVEALRLYEHLEHGRLLDFARDSYFPERWHPPVNPHVRWYPPVHAWCVAPFFAVLGPSDLSARLPSVFFLFGTCLVFFALARRLARGSPALSGLLAVILVLSAPNLLTFSAQSIVAGASVFFCFLALLAYLRSLERGHSLRGRSLVAGFLLGIAVLTKYDHGGVLAVCIGLSELWRVRFDPRKLLRGGAAWLFLVAGGMVVAWFAHPDKLASLVDSARHPFFGTPRTILFDFVLTWIVEYGSGIAVGALAFLAAIFLSRRLSDPAVRVVWIWGVISLVFYALRGRFHFRYNIVEAPIFLLMLAVVLPDLVERVRARLTDPKLRRRTALGVVLWFTGALGTLAGLIAAVAPARVFELARGPARWFHGLRNDHWGLRIAPDEYVDHFASSHAEFVSFFGSSLTSVAIAVFVLGAATLTWRYLPATRRNSVFVVWAAVAVAVLPGVARLCSQLRGMVEWELEGHPELIQLQDFVIRNAPPGEVVLLGGGWDQLTNNGLRWYRVTRALDGRPPLGSVEVVGDMIGSAVFPPEPRIAWWAERLATAPGAELPRRLVLVEPGPQFLYRTRFGPEVAIYDEIVRARRSYEEIAQRTFPVLGCTVRVLRREGEPPPIDPPTELLERHGVRTDLVGPESSRYWVGEGGWSLRDESLRHFVAR